MGTHLTNRKIILSGDILERFQYALPVAYNFIRKPSQGGSSLVRESPEAVLARSLSQTKHKLVRTINSNARQWLDQSQNPFEPKFTTLTFAENVADLNTANHEFTNFLKNFNYYLTRSRVNHLRYVCVPEFQKRRAVHFHSVFFNLPWFQNETLREIWSHGFVNIRGVSHVPNVGMYMTKYMTKDAIDNRLIGRKRYFSSRNLNRPILIRDPYRVDVVTKIIRGVPTTYENTYESKHQGETELRVYDLAKFPEAKRLVIEFLR